MYRILKFCYIAATHQNPGIGKWPEWCIARDKLIDGGLHPFWNECVYRDVQCNNFPRIISQPDKIPGIWSR